MPSAPFTGLGGTLGAVDVGAGVLVVTVAVLIGGVGVAVDRWRPCKRMVAVGVAAASSLASRLPVGVAVSVAVGTVGVGVDVGPVGVGVNVAVAVLLALEVELALRLADSLRGGRAPRRSRRRDPTVAVEIAACACVQRGAISAMFTMRTNLDRDDLVVVAVAAAVLRGALASPRSTAATVGRIASRERFTIERSVPWPPTEARHD
jgi:hypothetical protein